MVSAHEGNAAVKCLIAGLEQKVFENPDDDESRKALADAYSEANNPLGSFIRLHYRLEEETLPRNARERLVARKLKLLDSIDSERLWSLFGRRQGFLHEILRIDDDGDRYMFRNLCYFGELYDVWLKKELLDNGKRHYPEAWADYTDNSFWKLIPTALYNSMFFALDSAKGHEDILMDMVADDIASLMLDQLSRSWIITGTSALYTSLGKDTARHNPGQEYGRCFSADLVGGSGFLDRGVKSEDVAGALLGTRDVERVDEVYIGLTGSRPAIQLAGRKPSLDRVRYSTIGIINDSIWIYAAGDVRKWPAFGAAIMHVGRRNVD
jgi:hypothetical protein